MTTQSLTRTETLMVSTGTLFLGSPLPPPFFENWPLLPDTQLNQTADQEGEHCELRLCLSLPLRLPHLHTSKRGVDARRGLMSAPTRCVQKKTSTRVTFACPLWGRVELVLPSAGEGMVKKCGPAESARWIRSCCEGVVTSTPQHGRQRNVSRPISPLPVLKPATLCRLSYASP